MKIPEKYRKWFTKKAWFNCFRVAVALFVISYGCLNFAHATVFSEATSVWLKALHLIGMAFLFSLILWLLALISPELMETIFTMLRFEDKKDKGDEGKA